MTQYEFEKLIEKYLQGQCSAEEELQLDEWSNKQMQHVKAPMSHERILIQKKRLWHNIQRSTNTKSFLLRKMNVYSLGLVASVLLLIVFSPIVYRNIISKTGINKNTSGKLAGVEMINTTNSPQSVTLNDGTTVSLQPKSSLIYPEKFGDNNRVVYLKGEGFFKVKRDTTKPFLVYAGTLVTEVLGTSFTIKSFEKDKVAEVIVLSGKVKVYSSENGDVNKKFGKETILTPNQKIVFNKTTQYIQPQVVENPVVLNPVQSVSNFIFQDTPLFDVIKKIENIYGLHVVISPSLENCQFSGDLNGLDFNTQLDLICKSVNASSEKKDTLIVINGEGCK